MLRRNSKISLALSLCLIGASSQADIGYTRQPLYRVQEINNRAARDQTCLPDYAKSVYIGDVNDFGYAVGSAVCYKNSESPVRVNHAIGGFAFTGVDALPSLYPTETSSWAYSVNNWGVAVGFAAGSYSPFYGERWTPGGGVQLAFEPEAACKTVFNFNWGGASAINDRGTIAGFTSVMDPSGYFCITKFGLQTRSGERYLFPTPNQGGGLNSINNKDIAVGIGDNDAVELTKTDGFISLYSGTADLAGEAYRINERDEVIGSLVANRLAAPNGRSGSRQDPVWWDNKKSMHMLAMPVDATHGRPFDINEYGEIVGAVGTEDLSNGIDVQHTVRATLWRKDHIYDLNKYIVGKSVVLISAWVINNYGQIYATGFDPKEPLKKCPISYYDTATAQMVNLPDHQCANERLYLLTPVGL